MDVSKPPREPDCGSDRAAASTAWKQSFFFIHLGLALILLGNFAIRHFFERCQIISYFDLSGSFDRQAASNPWGFLLPFDIGRGQYCWCTTGAVVVAILDRLFTPWTTFHVLNALLIVTSFWASWAALRSRVFTFTYTICMAFGTQFHYAYALSAIIAFYLYITYLQVNLLCAYQLITADENRGWWRTLFLMSLALLVLCHETWLNYYVFLIAAAVFLHFYFRRRGEMPKFRRAYFVLGITTLAACIYVPIKVYYGRQHFSSGAEDELILGYRYPLLAFEDFVSNFITYMYMSLTNYCPPFLLSSNSHYLLGTDAIVAEQHGYHSQYTHLVPMHHLFYWYFYAGMVLVVFSYFLTKSISKACRTGSSAWAGIALILLFVAAGSSTHLMIKYRPYMSVPALTYKCLTSVVGTTLLISYLLMQWRGAVPRRAYALSILFVWGTVIVSGLFRPAYLSHLNRQVGLGSYPNTAREAGQTLKRALKGLRGFVPHGANSSLR